MRIFLLTDLEGIAGVDNIEQMDQAKDTYRNTCEMLEHSINLAVAACYDSGAEQVYYMDGHGGRKTINVNPENIDGYIQKVAKAIQDAIDMENARIG